MSLDRSLKGKSTLERHRNVLKRSERVTILEDNEKWTEEKSLIFGLLKVSHRKAATGKKAAKTPAAEAGATVAAVSTAGAVPTAGAPTGKASAPTGKAAAPAGKAAASSSAPGTKGKK